MRFSRTFLGLSCFSCGTAHDAASLQTVCTRCGLPLRADYRLALGAMDLATVRARPPSLWRYEEVLPIPHVDAVTLSEGFTPIVEVDGVKRLRRSFSFDDFAQALSFGVRVGSVAEEEGHHPALLIEWGRLRAEWWTHAIGGLHRNDFVMAAKTDELVEPRR